MSNNVYDMQNARKQKEQRDKQAKDEKARRRILKAAEKIKW